MSITDKDAKKLFLSKTKKVKNNLKQKQEDHALSEDLHPIIKPSWDEAKKEKEEDEEDEGLEKVKGKKLLSKVYQGGGIVNPHQEKAKSHLIPASQIPRSDPLYKVSNPKEVQRVAKSVFGKDFIVYKSNRQNKKYQIKNPEGKWVHFGDNRYEDWTHHRDQIRREDYLRRAINIKGDWKNDPYSANSLAIGLLW